MPLRKQSNDLGPNLRSTPSNRRAKGAPKIPQVELRKPANQNLAKRRIVASKGQILMAEKPLQPRTGFPFFRDLPPEVRVRIWLLSAKQRFVGLKFDNSKFKLPAIFHVNQEARHEAKSHIWTLNMPDWGIIANPHVDILFLDPCSFSNKFTYHQDVFHTLTCGTVFDRDQIKGFTGMAITMKEVLSIWNRRCLHCYIITNFLKVLPNLIEINIMLRQGVEGAEPSDMWILADQDQTSQVESHSKFIDDVKNIWQRVCEEDQRFDKITLNFVRTERWVR